MREPAVIAFLACTLMPLCVSCSREEEKSTAAPATKATVETSLYQGFEGETLKEKYSSRFERAAGGGNRSNVQITPPGHMFKDFNVRGRISEDQLKQVLRDLKAELLSLAKAGGVEVGDIREMAPDRLNGLPYAMFKGEYSGGLQGFYFSYKQAAIVGAVDVLAGSTADGSEKEWMLTCSVHEAAR